MTTTDRGTTERATFARMQDSTAADYDIITARRIEFLAGYTDRVLDALRLLDEGTEGYAVSRLEHSLQSATRASKDGRDDDYVAMCLLHDIGDTLAPRNHGELAASILKPFVPQRITWIAAHHPVFQLAYYGHQVGADPESRARVRRPRVVRRHRRVLRAVRRELLRRALPIAPARRVRAAAARHARTHPALGLARPLSATSPKAEL